MRLFVIVSVLALAAAGYFFQDSKIPDAHVSVGETNSAVSIPGQKLNLSHQSLNKVPSYVFSRISIQELDLSHNFLTGSLPAEIGRLKNLKVLDLSDNQFTGVPAEIGKLTKLEMLDLSENPITGLPYELGDLPALKVLNLRGTDYSELDLQRIREHLPAKTSILVD